MTGNKTVAASFVDAAAKPTYMLMVTTTGSGVVTINPEKTEFDSGAAVAIEAFCANGGTFNGWGGALSGKDPAVTIIMDGNKNITASFTGNNIIVNNLVKNGDFSDGAANWNFGTYNNAKGTGAAADGVYKISIESAGSESWHVQLTQTGISLTKDENYVLSFSAMAQSNTSIVVNVGMSAEPYTSYSSEQAIPVTTTKQEKTIRFSMKEASTGSARIEFNAGKAGGGIQIDDIELSTAIEIGAIAPRRQPAPRSDGRLNLHGGERISVLWYDHAGRLLKSVSGEEYHDAIIRPDIRIHGSYITVIRIGGRQLVRRAVTIGE
jgi:hypothetical protein